MEAQGGLYSEEDDEIMDDDLDDYYDEYDDYDDYDYDSELDDYSYDDEDDEDDDELGRSTGLDYYYDD